MVLSIGRLVRFHTAALELAAIVTATDEERALAWLTVFPPSGNPFPVDAVKEGTEAGEWSWPELTKEAARGEAQAEPAEQATGDRPALQVSRGIQDESGRGETGAETVGGIRAPDADQGSRPVSGPTTQREVDVDEFERLERLEEAVRFLAGHTGQADTVDKILTQPRAQEAAKEA